MLNLSTHISIETIKQSKKLQGIECESNYYWNNEVKRFAIFTQAEYQLEGKYKSNYMISDYPAPTLADVISNAESLFEDKKIHRVYDPEGYSDYKSYEELYDIFPGDELNNSTIFSLEERMEFFNHQENILTMCQQDKPLEEIEKYILLNIKE